MRVLLDENLPHKTPMVIPKWQIAFTARLAIMSVLMLTCYLHCAPLERGHCRYRDSTDISLRWSEGFYRTKEQI